MEKVVNKPKFDYKCHLEVCSNERFEYVHRFPNNKERRQPWIDAIIGAGLSMYKVRFLCSRHFREEDYISPESRFLNRNAVPSLNFTQLNQLDKCRKIKPISFYGNESEPPGTETNTASHHVTECDVVQNLGKGNDKKIKLQIVEGRDERKDNESHQIGSENIKRTLKCDALNERKRIVELYDAVEQESPEIHFKKAKVEIVEQADDGDDEDIVEVLLEADDEHFTIEDLEMVQNLNGIKTVIEHESVPAEVRPQQQMKDTNYIVPASATQTKDLQNAKDTALVELAQSDCVIQVDGHQLIIQHIDFDEDLILDVNWLYDSCKCVKCFNSETGLRKNDITAVPLNLQPELATIIEDNLEIKWKNKHTSYYSLMEIFHAQSAQGSSIISNQKPWNAKLTKFCDDFNPINFNDLICIKDIENLALNRLQRSGIVLISNISIDAKQQPLMLELLLRRLFPNNCQQLIREQRSDFTNSPHQQPHTNCSFLSESCGLQILSMSPSANTTATFTALDGFNAALQLRAMSRQSFDCLTKFNLPLIYRNSEENFDYCTHAPIIEIQNDDTIKRIQYAPYHRGNMPEKNLQKFVEAFRKLRKIMENDKNNWTVSLRKGMLIILDNWRICWQLKADSTSKAVQSNLVLNCIYLDRKHVLSRINRLKAND